MRLESVRAETTGGKVRLTGVVARAGGQAPSEVWFEYPQEYADFVRADADVFIPLLLAGAMREGEALETELPVSAQLAGELSRIRAVLAWWFPGKNRIAQVRLPNLVRKDRSEIDAAGTFFSAGVDAYYTVLKAREGHRADQPPLTHLIYMRGLEAPLSKIEDGKSERLLEIADRLGYPLIVGSTNLRDVFAYEYLPFVCGPALAGVSLSLSGGLSSIRVPAGSSYDIEEMQPSSTQHMIDRRWSTEYLHITRDGGESKRHEKVEFLLDYPLAIENLSICTYNLGEWRNCGVCPKCVRTAITLQLLGALEKCPGLPSPFDYRLIRKIKLKSFAEWYLFRGNLALAQRTHNDPLLARKLRRKLWRYEKYRALVGLVSDTPLHPPARALRALVKRLLKR